MPEVVTREQLADRLEKVRAMKDERIAQVNALIGREAELVELIALLDTPPESA